MSWSTLSEDLWKRILEYVPLEDRLRSCSVVNTTLHRAAAAATRAVTADDVAFSEQALPGLCQWMTHHGQHLTSLQLSGSGDEQLTQLPCPNLRQLDLAYIKVQLDSSSTPPGVLHSCTRLTWLRLDSCYFTNTDENYGSSLAALSALVELQHLALLENRDAGGSEWMPSTVLKQLPHLTYLRVRDQNVDMLGTRSLQHVSCLTKLQRLHLAGFRAQQRRVCLSPSTTPRLNRLTALRQVTLENVSLDPTILQDCTQLHVLKLLRVPIIAAGGAAARAAALHSLFDRLQHLQSLELHQLHRPAAAAAYTSLTASSALQALHLTVDDMPAGVWPHVFPPDRQLPALQELTLRWYHMDAWHPPPAAAMGTNDLGCITVCCRELRGISISVQPDTQLAALAKASGLTRLSVSGLYADGFQSLKALSGLVSLQELSVDLGGAITPSNLLCWTALRPLTRMSINPVMLPEFEGAYDVPLALAQGRCLGGQLDAPVWLQLLQHCGRFSECQPLIFDSMGRQLVEQQQRHTHHEQEVAAQQQQIAELQAALSEQHRRTLKLQEQLAATRAQAAASQSAAAASQAAAEAAATAAAQVQGRVQALEGQVQQLLQTMQCQGV